MSAPAQLQGSDNVTALSYNRDLDQLAVGETNGTVDILKDGVVAKTLSPTPIGSITALAYARGDLLRSDGTNALWHYNGADVGENIGLPGIVDVTFFDTNYDTNPTWMNGVFASWQTEAQPSGRYLGQYATVAAAIADGGGVGDWYKRNNALTWYQITALTPTETEIFRGQGNFPQFGLVVATATQVVICDIFKGQPRMWKVRSITGTVSSAEYTEGRLEIGVGAGKYQLDYIADVTRWWTTAGNSEAATVDGVPATPTAGAAIVNDTVNDVAATVLTLEGKSDNTNYFLIGDSLCTPNGRPAPSTDNGIVSWNWQLQNEGLYNFTVDAQNGRAIAGYTAPAYIKPEVGRVRVIIEMGSNDANGVTTETQYKESYQALMADLISRGFLRENIYNLLPPLAEDAPPTTDVLNARLAEVRTWTLDLFPDAWDIPTRPGPYLDFLHPTQDGHTGFKQRWLPFLSQASDRGGVLTTNLLSGTDVLATQSVTTVAGLYTVSFTGAGSIALTGTATGTLDSATYPQQDRQSLTFTATAGSLTLTVTGDVRLAQLEQSATLHDYVPSLVGPNSDYTNPAKQLINRDIGGGQFVTDDINMFIPDWAVATAGGVSAGRDSGAVWDITGQTDAPAYIDYTADQKIMTSYQIEAEQAV